jgi:hypothetical protein
MTYQQSSKIADLTATDPFPVRHRLRGLRH